MLKKSESILQRGAGIMRDLFGGSSTDVHMEEEEVKLTSPGQKRFMAGTQYLSPLSKYR